MREAKVVPGFLFAVKPNRSFRVFSSIIKGSPARGWVDGLDRCMVVAKSPEGTLVVFKHGMGWITGFISDEIIPLDGKPWEEQQL